MSDKDGPTNRPTQVDIARLAGVSQAMVSLVLSNKTHAAILPDTRRRVLDAARQLGYVPNRAARSLRTRKSYTVGCIIPDITNPFYPDFARGIQDVTEDSGYDLVLYNTDGRPDKEKRCLNSLVESGVGGVIGVFFHTTAVELARLLAQDIPVVRLEATRKRAGTLPLDNLYVDNVSAAGAVVAYLIERGHTRIATISGQSGPQQMRLLGYQQALNTHGIRFNEDLVVGGDYREQGGYHAMRKLLELRPLPTAVFAANDEMAMGALLAISEAGLRVPDDIAVAGFDDIPVARLTNPPLTTVAQYQNRLGKRAAEMLLDRLEGHGPVEGRSEEMPFELKIRESA